MRLLPRVGRARAALGPGTPARHGPVPGPGTGGGFRHPAHGARGGDAPRAAGRTRVRRRRRGARAAAAVAGEALARLAVLVAGRAAPREAGVRVDRPPAPLPGAWLPGSLAWRREVEEFSMTVATLNADAVRTALRQVKDPELDLNIIDLGLVYDVEIDEGEVRVTMTLTSPGCPAGPMITNDVYRVLRALDGVKDVNIDIVWEPYWTPERIDPKIRALMGF